MSVTTLSSREFNQDASGAKKAAMLGPVFITDRGRPAHVLLSIADYQKMVSGSVNIVDMLAMSADVEFEPVRAAGLYKTADLS
ncbi:MAG: type II toxin-antitoxin system Phd/YefM family antitoxin [Sulfuriferula sp.]|nr:type II toxin-antitoxin system Phd/YefM family antitoxin [Sulfuriferula sp.]